MSKPYAVVFAGVPGSSKTIIAYYLSGKFGLPMFSNDQLRYEVKEDMLVDGLVLKEDLLAKGINQPLALAEFERRLTSRMEELIATGRPLIIDGSVDRRWPERKNQLIKHGYDWFMINMELSRGFLEHLFSATGRANFIPQLDKYFADHQAFFKKYGGEVAVEINDFNFSNRTIVATKALEKYTKSL